MKNQPMGIIFPLEQTIKMLIEEHNHLTGNNNAIRVGVDFDSFHFTYNGELHQGFHDPVDLNIAIMVTIQQLINTYEK